MLSIEAGDYVVFELDEDEKFVKVYKWHKGVERSRPDYGYEDLRHQSRGKRVKKGRQ